MGSPMAACVARGGFDTTAFDIDPARAAALTDDGVKPAATIREAAGGADVLVAHGRDPDQVESVLFGDDPAAAALSPGAAVVVMATVGPAPVVSGGPSGSRSIRSIWSTRRSPAAPPVPPQETC